MSSDSTSSDICGWAGVLRTKCDVQQHTFYQQESYNKIACNVSTLRIHPESHFIRMPAVFVCVILVSLLAVPMCHNMLDTARVAVTRKGSHGLNPTRMVRRLLCEMLW